MCTLAACSTATQSAGTANKDARDAEQRALANERVASDSVRSGSIGVIPFQLNGKDETLTALGYALADLLTTDLSRSKRLTLVERSRLADVLKEIDVSRGDRFDSSSTPIAGRIMRAQQLVLGALDTMPGGELRLSLRLADVATGRVEQAIDARSTLQDILAAEKELAFRMFDVLGVTLTPSERALVEARQTSSVAALIAYGRGIQAEVGGDTRKAADEYQRAARIDAAFSGAAARASSIQGSATSGATMLAPGARAMGAAVSGTVDRLNRPLDLVTSMVRPQGGVGDPAFPGTLATIVITVRRP
jgi:TolB-like protein